MNIAAIIVGIDGWEKYTLPLIESIQKWEPSCAIRVVDNKSEEPYPWGDNTAYQVTQWVSERLCYSAAINRGKYGSPDADWYIVLSNDVLCTGPFADTLAEYGNEVVGPALKQTHGFDYIEGWCVAIPRAVWDAVGGWDERFLGSDWEDVAFSTAARNKGFNLVADLPFTHLDQRQRFDIVGNFAGKNDHNRRLFLREYAGIDVSAGEQFLSEKQMKTLALAYVSNYPDTILSDTEIKAFLRACLQSATLGRCIEMAADGLLSIAYDKDADTFSFLTTEKGEQHEAGQVTA